MSETIEKVATGCIQDWQN